MNAITSVLPAVIDRLQRADSELSSGLSHISQSRQSDFSRIDYDNLKLAQMDILVVLNALKGMYESVKFIPDELIIMNRRVA